MRKSLVDLWNGRLPLGRAFWTHMVLYGLLANIAATAGLYAAIAAGLPTALAIAIFVLPAPYWLAASVGVWRSAERYQGPPAWSLAARMLAPAWLLLMLVT